MTKGEGIHLGDLGIGVGFILDEADLLRKLQAAEARLGKKFVLPVTVQTQGVVTDLRAVRTELDNLAGQSAKTSREQAAAYTLSARLAAQSAREQQAADRASVQSLADQQRAYRNLWQARQLSDDEVIEAQRRIYQQALLQSQAVDKQSEAYRRLTQVMAGAQRTIDSAQGLNTPGGFGAGISQGILQALGNLGPFGQLLEQIVNAGMQAAQTAAREGAQDVAQQAGAGLQAGLAGQAAKTRQAAMNLADQVTEGAEDALDIRSPSRVMRRVGAFAGEGLADGLLSKRAEVAAAAKALANDVERNGAPQLGGVSGGGMGGVAVIPSAQAGLGKVATHAALATAALGGTALAVTALGAGFANGARKAAEYEQGLAELSLLTDKLPSQLGGVGNAMLKMTTDLGVSFSELKAGLAEIYGASVRGTDSDENALTFLETSAKLAKVAMTDTRTAADALTSVLNAYGMSAADAGKVSDMLWTSIKVGKVSLAETAGSLGAVAGQAKSLGVPLNELLASMSLLTTKGIPASTALEYIRSALTNVQKPSEEAKKTAKALNIEFDAMALKRLGLVGFLEQLGRGVGDNSTAMAQLLGDVGGLNAVIGLLADGMGDTKAALDAVSGSAGSLDRDVQKLKGTAAQSGKEFYEAWNRVGILFSSTILPTFTRFLNDGLTPLLVKLGDLKAQLNEVKSPGELKATLKIDAADDATTAILKFLTGAAQGVKDGLKWSLESSGVLENVQKLQAFQLQQELQNRNLIATPKAGDIGGLMTQYREISQNMAKYQQILADALKVSTEAVTGLQTAINQGNAFQPQPAQPLPDGVVGGLTALARLGTLRSGGTPFGQMYDPDGDGNSARHNGEDLFAKVSTPVLASFGGMLETRWSETTGRILELVDAQGKRMLLGHLQGVKGSLQGLPKDIQAAFQASGGKAIQVAAGQTIGYVGQTGSMANKQLGPQNAHVHVMAYDENGAPIDPKNIKWVPLASLVPNSASTAAKFKPASDQALIAEARRILSKIEGYEKTGNLTAKVQAEGVLKAFTDSGPRAAAAVEYVQSQVKAAAKELSKFGQGYDQLKTQFDQAGSLFKINDNAQAYIKSLNDIAAAAQNAAAAERKKNGETDKYRALLDLAGDAAGKARQQRESASKDEAAAATNRLKTQQDLQKALAQGREQDARRALQSLKDQQTAELALAKDNAAKRAQIVTQTGPAIIAAEDRIANLKRDLAVREAQRVADEAKKLPGADLGAIEAARVETVRQAYATAAAERTAARREQAQAERAAGAQLKEEQDRLNQQLRAGRVTAAEQTLARIQELNRQEVAAFEGTAEERLDLVRRQSQAEFDSAERIARLKRNNAVLEAQAGPTELRAQRLAAAELEYQNTVLKLRGDRLNVVRAAQQGVTQAQLDFNVALQEGVEASEQALANLEKYLEGSGEAARAAALAAQDTTPEFNRLFDQIVANREELQTEGVADAWVESIEELGRRAGLTAAQVGVLVSAIRDLQATDPVELLPDNLQGRGVTNEPDVFDPATGNLTDGEAEALARQFWGKSTEYLKEVLAGLSNQDSPLATLLTGGITATTLLDTLANETDPAALQGLMGDVAEFMESDIGKALPATIRDALAAGVRDAQAYVDILQGITADAVTDGAREAVQNAGPAPTNRFKELDASLTSGQTDYSNPEAVSLLVGELEAARRAGELTDAQLRTLKATVQDLAAGPVVEGEFIPTQTEERVISLVNNVAQLREGLEQGTLTVQDFTGSAVSLLPTLDAVLAGLVASGQGSSELAVLLREAREELLKLGGAALEATLFLQGFSKFTSGLSSVFKGFGADGLGAVVDGLAQVVDQASRAPAAFDAMKTSWEAFSKTKNLSTIGGLLGGLGGMLNIAGAVIGAIVGIGNAIESMSPGIQAWKKDLREVAEEQKRALGANTGGFKSPWAAALEADAEARDKLASSNWLQRLGWSLFGGAPEVMKTESARLLAELQTIFADLGSGVANIWQNSMLTAFRAGDMQGWAENFSKEFDLMFGETVLKTLINAAITEGAVANDLAALTEAVKNKDWAALPGILARAKSSAQAAGAEIAQVAPLLPGYGQGGSGGAGAGGSSYVGTAPVAQIGTPRFELTLPTEYLAAFATFNTAAPIFLEGSRTLLDAARLLLASQRSGSGGGNSGPPPLSGLGGLT